MARRKSVSKATRKAAVVAAAVQEAREYIPTLGSLEPRTVLPMATRDEAIRALMNSLNKEDKKVIVYADEAPNTYIIRRPTGIMELDVDIGGGFPAGGCCMISGPDNSGKTRLLLETMAMQQRLYGDECRIALAITEGGFPFDQARDAKLKVCLPDSMILQYQRLRMERRLPLLTDEEVIAAYKQRVGQVVVIRGETGEEILGYVLKAIATRAFSFIGVDSINGLLPTADAAKDLVKNPKKAAHAFLIDNFFKHYISPMTTGVTGTNETTLVFTQQVRANQERANAPAHLQQYIKPWAVSGAYAAKHFKLIDLTVSDGKVLRQKSDQEGERGPVIGKMVNWMLEKGKAGTHDNKSGEVAYYYGINRFDIAGEIIVSGMRRGVIQQVGRKWCVCRPTTGEVLPDLTALSQKALRSMIEADFEFELAVRREILASAGIECLYR